MDWLSGSGGTGETHLHYRATSGKPRLRASCRVAVRWRRGRLINIFEEINLRTKLSD
jgi:hypothetical protein